MNKSKKVASKHKIIYTIVAISVVSIIAIPVIAFLKQDTAMTNGEKCYEKQIEAQEKYGPATDIYYPVCNMPTDDK